MPSDTLTRDLAKAAASTYPGETAIMLERHTTLDIAAFLGEHEPAVASDVLRRLRADRAAEVVELLDQQSASAMLGSLEPMQAASLIARLDPDARERRLAALDARLSGEIRELIAYPSTAAGSLMDPRVTSFRPETTVRETLGRLRGLKNKGIHDIFLVDEEGRLDGVVAVQDLALADVGTALSDLAHPAPSVPAFGPQDALLELAEERRLTSVAVVDVNDRLVGVVRYADLLSASHRDATADMGSMVGVSREERALSPVGFAVRKRLPWLQVNLGTAFLAAAVVGLFESTIAQFTALAVLLPVVAGQSGNTGAQALAVTMRGLALREIGQRHWGRIVRKELAIGCINGVAVAAITGLGVLLWSGSVGLAGVIASAMILSMVLASASGVSVPMLLIAMRQDPAAASSIVLTTITDVVGFLTFLGFATMAQAWL
jgi:magnesium transporter